MNSIFTLGLMIGVSVGDTTLGTTVANLGMADTRFAHPVFIGDTLRAETTVAEKRESRSRPDAGIVVFDHRCFNQRAEEVAYCKRSALMRKRQRHDSPIAAVRARRQRTQARQVGILARRRAGARPRGRGGGGSHRSGAHDGARVSARRIAIARRLSCGSESIRSRRQRRRWTWPQSSPARPTA